MNGQWIQKPQRGTAVVFVHGILSSGETCWQPKAGRSWPELLKPEPNLEGLGIYSYSYRTGIFSGSYRLGDVVDDLKERMGLDGLYDCARLVFVCHSMGGLVVRKFLVERRMDLIEREIEVGLFLVASPSLGSGYANLISGLAKALGHSQAQALRFSQNNEWLNGLDKEFLNLKEKGRLRIKGKELYEDTFVVLKKFWFLKQVVPPFSGARYFGERYKVPGSDHFSISKPKDNKAIQHRLLCQFIEGFAQPEPPPEEESIAHDGEAAATPGSLPPIWKVPYLRNPDFAGREEELAALYKALRSGEPAALTQVFSGLGGVGKTQLALEYAYRYRAEYDTVWWISAEDPISLADEYAQLAAKYKLPEAGAQDQAVTVQAVREHLGRVGDWLLIFDNAEDKHALLPFLPQGERGHVLITARNPDWDGVARPLRIGVWQREEAVAFLVACTGLVANQDLDQVAEALGDLPLALAQAAAYMKQSGIGAAAYLDRFKAEGADHWTKETRPLNYEETVATTWGLAMDRLAEDTPEAAAVFHLCAFLAPDEIPRSLLAQGAHLSEAQATLFGDEGALTKGIRALAKYALIEAGRAYISVHRLVQDIVRARLPEEEARTWAEAALALVDQAWPQGYFSAPEWPTCALLMPHSQAALKHARTLDVDAAQSATLANRMGFYLEGRGLLDAAEPYYRRALEVRERVLGADHPSTLTSVNNLGYLLDSRGLFNEAEPYYRRALEVRARVLGADHPDTLTSVNNLGSLLRTKGFLNEAEPYFRLALEVRERALGPDHPDTLQSVNNLGGLLQAQGFLDEAEPYFRRALDGCERVLGADHPHTLMSVNNLAALLQAQGFLDEAEPYFRRALEVRERVLGADHPDTLMSVNNLGSLLLAKGFLDEAEPYFRRALDGCERVLGADHPDTLMSVNDLAALLQAKGHLAAAEPYFRRALDGCERVLGAAHPTTKIVRGNLAYVLSRLGRR